MTTISTWFVEDDSASATFFPQSRGKSDSKIIQDIYWRCIATFFASSVVLNHGRRHRFYTNTRLPEVDGFSFEEHFDRWNVEVIRLPITFRLPTGRVSLWGNQFYIFDIIKYISQVPPDGRHIILDSDCVWIKPIDKIEHAIDDYGILTYDVYQEQRDPDQSINGVSMQQLGNFLSSISNSQIDRVVYCGGEWFSCRHQDAVRLSKLLDPYWRATLAGTPHAPREEAHLLSLLYAHCGYPIGTADPFIRRIWTSLRYHNARPEDLELTVWHLPAEKRTGLVRLFNRIPPPSTDVSCMIEAGFNLKTYKDLFGIPSLSAKKILIDSAIAVSAKIAEAFHD